MALVRPIHEFTKLAIVPAHLTYFNTYQVTKTPVSEEVHPSPEGISTLIPSEWIAHLLIGKRNTSRGLLTGKSISGLPVEGSVTST